MILQSRFVVAALLMSTVTAPAVSGEAQVGNDGSITWQAGVDGVEIEWNSDGSMKRIYSRYSTPVEFADRKGIATGQIIAEEKAKAGIVRFMQQSVASTRVVAEVQADVSKAVQQRGTGATAQVRKTNERTSIESLTEVTTSFAAGTLRGVVVLEKGYDEKAQEAWVVVGISRKTIGAAERVRTMSEDSRRSQTSEQPNGIGNQPTEVRRSRQKDW